VEPGDDAPVTELWMAHTADLTAAELSAARDLLLAAFDGDFGEQDWDHALGGLHATIWEDGALIGHASVVQRRLLHGGRALRAGYVEAVGVRRDRRRRGHAGQLIRAVERVIRSGYQLGALASSEQGAALYVGRGWLRWVGPTSALTPAGIRRTADEDGGIFVLRGTAELDLHGELSCDWRDGDVW
jgi:aminoglycoside 2'-N-acetyltransferase I